MAETYKQLYEQTKKMLDKYQDEVVPVLRDENKRLYYQLHVITKERDYYRDAYHHLLKERKDES